jgi:polyphosphate kinase 2 (PPK2 family)
MLDSGIILIKYWLEVGMEEQTRRLESRIDDPRKIWKLSDLDLKSYSRWYDYSRARDDMFTATDTGWAPWYLARTDDKKRTRLNIITHLLSQVRPTSQSAERRSPCLTGTSPTAIPNRTCRAAISPHRSDRISTHDDHR